MTLLYRTIENGQVIFFLIPKIIGDIQEDPT